MNKTHLTARAGASVPSRIAGAGVRESFPGRDELDDVPGSPWMHSVLIDEAGNWPEEEGGAAYAGSGCSEQADDSLPHDVETGINLLLRGVSYL